MAIDIHESDSIHPDKIFWFVVYLVTFGFSYIAVITFFPIPKENVRFADTCLGFLLGTALTTAIGYLLVGSPGKKGISPILPPGTTQEVNATSTTTTIITSDEEPQ